MTETNERQTFRYGAWVFDIDKALDIIEATPRGSKLTSVADWVSAYHLDLLRPDHDGQPGRPIFGPDQSYFNVDHAMQTALGTPVIIGLMEFDGKPAQLLIDGTHRMYRAMMTGADTLPAYFLTVAETAQIRER